jgi:hypothetical protein
MLQYTVFPLTSIIIQQSALLPAPFASVKSIDCKIMVLLADDYCFFYRTIITTRNLGQPNMDIKCMLKTCGSSFSL